MFTSTETFYAGHTFRSRLEARWAIFFDALAIEWQYEPECFNMGPLGKYLPDFLLPDLETWIEIKPIRNDVPEAEALADKKIAALSAGTGNRCMILWGDPIDRVSVDPSEQHGEGGIYFGEHGWDNNYAFCICPHCGKAGLEFDGRGSRVCRSGDKCPGTGVHDNPDYYGHLEHGDKAYSWDHPRILKAAEIAWTVRFDRGHTKRQEPLEKGFVYPLSRDLPMKARLSMSL